MIENIEPQALVDYVGHTQAALQKSASQVAELDAIKAQQKQAAELIPAVVDELIAHHRIDPHQKEAALAALQDHTKTLQLFQRLAGHRNEKEAAAIGKPVGEDYNKSASYSPIGGSPSTLRESDRRFFANMGVTITD